MQPSVIGVLGALQKSRKISNSIVYCYIVLKIKNSGTIVQLDRPMVRMSEVLPSYISNYIAHPLNQAKKERPEKRKENNNGSISMQPSVLKLSGYLAQIVTDRS